MIGVTLSLIICVQVPGFGSHRQTECRPWTPFWLTFIIYDLRQLVLAVRLANKSITSKLENVCRIRWKFELYLRCHQTKVGTTPLKEVWLLLWLPEHALLQSIETKVVEVVAAPLTPPEAQSEVLTIGASSWDSLKPPKLV